MYVHWSKLFSIMKLKVKLLNSFPLDIVLFESESNNNKQTQKNKKNNKKRKKVGGAMQALKCQLVSSFSFVKYGHNILPS